MDYVPNVGQLKAGESLAWFLLLDALDALDAGRKGAGWERGGFEEVQGGMASPAVEGCGGGGDGGGRGEVQGCEVLCTLGEEFQQCFLDFWLKQDFIGKGSP